MYKLQPLKVTKELILTKVSEETLMEHYLGVPVTKGLHKSPLRNDIKPTCSFYRNKNGDLMFKDFGSNFNGNFISVVMSKFNCSFYKSLQIIANDFGIISRPDLFKNIPKIKYTNTHFVETASATIQLELKKWDQKHLNFWLKYGINYSTLKKFKVFPCKNIFLNNNLFYLEQENKLVFGYYGGISNDLEQWRCYFPDRKKYKFISNWKSNRLQGGKQLPIEGGKYLVITKSMKDVMCLYEFGIPAIAPISEMLFISESQLKKLQQKFQHIFLLYDNDKAGMKSSAKIRREFPNVHILLIPKKYQVKDISDFRKIYGYKETINLINQVKAMY